MFKMLALDLDGTLLNLDHEISTKNKASIKSLREKGIKVIFASGRELTSILPYSTELEIKDYLISLNGAIISDYTGENIIHEENIESEVAKYIVKTCEEKDICSVVFVRNTLYVSTLDDERIKLFQKYSNSDLVVVGNVYDFLEKNKLWNSIGKILQSDDNEILNNLKEDIKDKFREKVVSEFSLPFFLETYCNKVSKGSALARIAREYGVDMCEVIAIGDSENDISMIERAGLGVAMANALDIVKEKADIITLSNGEDGVSHIIEKCWR